MARYALVRAGVVINVVEWSGGPEWSPPAGVIAVQNNTAKLADTYNGTVFTTPPPPAPDPANAKTRQAIQLLKATFQTTRTAAQLNNCIDALTYLMREQRDLGVS